MRGVSKLSSAWRIVGGAFSAAAYVSSDLADVREQVRLNSIRPPRAAEAPSTSSAASGIGAFLFWAAASPYLILAGAIVVFLLFGLADSMGVQIDKGAGGPLDTIAWSALLLGAACVYGFPLLAVAALVGLVLWIVGKPASDRHENEPVRDEAGERGA